MFQKISVIGAAGKMGRGIALLLLREITNIQDSPCQINLIDQDQKALQQLKAFSEVTENVHFSTDIKLAEGSDLIFETITEDLNAKVTLFKQLKDICPSNSYYLTNTSSIPIEEIDIKAGLDGHLIGFRFYYPAEIQKLTEIVAIKQTKPELRELASNLGKQLHKISIFSGDIAGFIGNGHLIHDITFGCQLTRSLTNSYTFDEAIYLVNKVTKDFMLRPTGIFQLIDSIGLKTCSNLVHSVNSRLQEKIAIDPLLDEMIAAGIKGGQKPDGTLNNGFFKYEKIVPKAIYSLEHQKYLPLIDAHWVKKCDETLGKMPIDLQWCQLAANANKEKLLNAYFHQLFQEQNLGSELAKKYLLHSKKIAEKLVQNNAASNIDDVNLVLQHGFHHLYGAVNGYF